MKKKIVGLLKILIPISLGLFLVFHIYNQLDAGQRKAMFESFRKANYFWIVISVIMGLTSHYIRGYRWRFQMEAMGYHTRTANNFMAVMIGYIVNMVLPRVGEVSRAAAITKYEKVPFQKSFGTILAERAIDMIVLMTIGIVTVILQYELLEEFANQMLAEISKAASSPKLWIGLVVAILLVFILFFVFKKLRHNSFFAKINALIDGLIEGLRSIFRMKRRVEYILATIAIWVLYIGMFWVCFFSLDATSHLGANAIFAAFVLGSFAIVLIPGGIGAYPVGIMQCLLLYGIAQETGFALGWIIWLSQTIMVVLFGGLSMLYIPVYNKKYPAHVES